jgi:hypothetical protein
MGRGQDGAGRWWCGGWKSKELDDHVLLLARKPAYSIVIRDRVVDSQLTHKREVDLLCDCKTMRDLKPKSIV